MCDFLVLELSEGRHRPTGTVCERRKKKKLPEYVRELGGEVRITVGLRSGVGKVFM